MISEGTKNGNMRDSVAAVKPVATNYLQHDSFFHSSFEVYNASQRRGTLSKIEKRWFTN